MALSGASGSGNLDFPEYIKETHFRFLWGFDYDGGNPDGPMGSDYKYNVKAVLRSLWPPTVTEGSSTDVIRPYFANHPLWASSPYFSPVTAAQDKLNFQESKLVGLRTGSDTVVKTRTEDYAESAADILDIQGVISQIDPSALAQNALGDVQTALFATRVGLTTAEISDAIQDFTLALEEAVDSAAKAGLVEAVDVQPLRETALTAASNSLAAAFANRNTGVDEVAFATRFLDTVRGQINSGFVLEVDASNEIFSAITDASVQLREVMNAAKATLDDGLLASLIASNATRQQAPRSRAIQELTAAFTGINGTSTSTYAFAFAALQADFTRQDSEFGSQISISLYQQGIQAHVAAFADSMRTRLSASSFNQELRLRLADVSLNTMSQLSLARMQYEQNVMGFFAEYKNRSEILDVNALTEQKQRKQQLALGTIDAISKAQLANKTLRAQYYNTLAETATERFNAYSRVAITEKVQRDGLFDSLFRTHTGLYELTLRAGASEYNASLDATRTMIAARAEHEMRDFAWRKERELWAFDALERATRLMAAPSGMMGVTTPGSSAVQSTLAGATTGAGLGATIGTAFGPGPGTAIGAGIGAVVGGLGGLIFG